MAATVFITNSFSDKSQTYIEVGIYRMPCTVNGKPTMTYGIRSELCTWGTWTGSHDQLRDWLDQCEENLPNTPENLAHLQTKVRQMKRFMAERGLKASWNDGADAMALRRRKFAVGI